MGEVTHWPNQLQTGSDVIHTGDDGGEGGNEVELFQGEQEEGSGQNQQVDGEEMVDAADIPVGKGLALEVDGGDGVRVEHLAHIAPGGL